MDKRFCNLRETNPCVVAREQRVADFLGLAVQQFVRLTGKLLTKYPRRFNLLISRLLFLCCERGIGAGFCQWLCNSVNESLLPSRSLWIACAALVEPVEFQMENAIGKRDWAIVIM